MTRACFIVWFFKLGEKNPIVLCSRDCCIFYILADFYIRNEPQFQENYLWAIGMLAPKGFG